jgi:hypothetical protein
MELLERQPDKRDATSACDDGLPPLMPAEVRAYGSCRRFVRTGISVDFVPSACDWPRPGPPGAAWVLLIKPGRARRLPLSPKGEAPLRRGFRVSEPVRGPPVVQKPGLADYVSPPSAPSLSPASAGLPFWGRRFGWSDRRQRRQYGGYAR